MVQQNKAPVQAHKKPGEELAPAGQVKQHAQTEKPAKSRFFRWFSSEKRVEKEAVKAQEKEEKKAEGGEEAGKKPGLIETGSLTTAVIFGVGFLVMICSPLAGPAAPAVAAAGAAIVGADLVMAAGLVVADTVKDALDKRSERNKASKTE